MQILQRVAGSRCRPSCLLAYYGGVLNPLVERILNGYICPFLTIDQSILLLAASGALFVLGIASLTAVILEEDEVAPVLCRSWQKHSMKTWLHYVIHCPMNEIGHLRKVIYHVRLQQS
jgi:hypothetical protein